MFSLFIVFLPFFMKCDIVISTPIPNQKVERNKDFSYYIPLDTFRSDSKSGLFGITWSVDTKNLPGWLGSKVVKKGERGRYFPISTSETCCNDIKIIGELAFIAGYWQGFRIVGIQDQDNPREVTYIKHDRISYTGIDIFGEYAFLSIDASGFDIYYIGDFSVTKKPEIIATVNGPGGNTNDIFCYGEKYVLTAGEDGLNMYDVSAKTNVTKITSVDIGDTGLFVEVRNDYIFLLTSDGLSIYQFDEHSKEIIPVGHGFSISSPSSMSFYQDHYLLVGSQKDATSYFNIISFKDISSPKIISSTMMEYDGLKIQNQGNLAFINMVKPDGTGKGQNLAFLYVLDIKDMNNPKEYGKYVMAESLDYPNPKSIAVHENYAFILYYYGGFFSVGLGGIFLEGTATKECEDYEISVIGEDLDDGSKIEAKFTLSVVGCPIFCKNISSNNSNVCNSHGVCYENDKCKCIGKNWNSKTFCGTCSSGYHGDKCQFYDDNNQKKNTGKNSGMILFAVLFPLMMTLITLICCCCCCCCCCLIVSCIVGGILLVLQIGSDFVVLGFLNKKGMEKLEGTIQKSKYEKVKKNMRAPEIFF